MPGRLLCFKLLRRLEADLPLRFAQHSAWKSLWLVEMWICEIAPEAVCIPVTRPVVLGRTAKLTIRNISGG